uniref:Exocyst subunit Exo70 family protein n=1 Tax=Chenopodium quinoa TaxID=63459 RepID=A0A803M0D3_CHEQI
MGSNSSERLLAARKSLNLSLEKSKSLGLALEKAGPRLEEINQRLPSLEAAVRPIRANEEALVAVVGHIDRAVGPAAAVLKVFDAVHGLEKSLLSDPRSDLPEDIVEYLEDNVLADERYLSELKKSLKGLREIQNDGEKTFLDGGLLEAALDKLEEEFRNLITENSVPLPMSSVEDQACIAPSPLPVAVIQKLQAILGRLIANNRLDKCISIYVEVRSANVRASLRALNLDYLEISIAEFNDVQSIEGIGLDVWMGCFAKIAAQAGILAFLQFGKTVTESKKDPIKLLKLLDIFASLNKLRLDFNRLFGGAACAEIQNLTRDLIRRVIEGACEIFWELLVQVELQRQTPPPVDGSVPRLVSFVTDYCNRLLGDDYKPLLTQVLVIQRSWKNEKFQEKLLINAILDILKAIELNLDAWSKMEGLILFSGGRATARDLVKRRLKKFNETFDEMYKKQSSWVVSDKELREKTWQLIVQAIVPVYRSYMQNYGPLVEQDSSSSKYAKYTAQSLEKMIMALFLPKPSRYSSFKGRQYSGKFNNAPADQQQPSPTAS